MMVMIAIGLGFGAIYELTGDIGAPMLAHVINNTFASLGMVILWLQGSFMVIAFLVVVLVVTYVLGGVSRKNR
jgi:membrane protease YdiL (CAAX protease family)